MHQHRPLILASSSRYRRELFGRLGLRFEWESPHADETPLENESSDATALRLAEVKARAVAVKHPGAVVIGSDQVAACEGKQFGKPGNHANALAQLQMLRGRVATFSTALCVAASNADGETMVQTDVAQTVVHFRSWSDAELETYLRIETPYDCAGSAKAEGLGIVLLERIESDDPTALIGLPLIRLVSMLRTLGYPLLSRRP